MEDSYKKWSDHFSWILYVLKKFFMLYISEMFAVWTRWVCMGGQTTNSYYIFKGKFKLNSFSSALIYDNILLLDLCNGGTLLIGSNHCK
jgi:hypothetical protein